MVAGRAQGVLRVQGTPVALEEELEFRAQVCRLQNNPRQHIRLKLNLNVIL